MIVGTKVLSTEFSTVPFSNLERGEVKIVLCNTLSLDNNFTLIISNPKLELSSTLFFNFPVLAFDTYIAPFSLTLAQGDSISAKASNSGLVLTIVK